MSKWFWISMIAGLLTVLALLPFIQQIGRDRAASAAVAPTAIPPVIANAQPYGTATVTGPPVMSPGNIVSIPVRRDRDSVPLNPILCIKCRASLYVPGVGDKVNLEWITLAQNSGAPPIFLLTATEYSPGHHP